MEHNGVWKPDGADWDESPEIWELQTGPHLTAGRLVQILAALDPELLLRVSVFDGAGGGPPLVPVEVGCTGPGDQAPTLLITVAPLGEES